MNIRQSVSALLAAVVLLVFAGTEALAATNYKADDLVNLKKYLLGFDVSADGLDVDGNGEINILDLVKMKKAIVSQSSNTDDNSSGSSSSHTSSDYELPLIPLN